MGHFDRPKSLLEAFWEEMDFRDSEAHVSFEKALGAFEAKTFENLIASMKENYLFWEGVDFPDSGAQMGSWPAWTPNGPI